MVFKIIAWLDVGNKICHKQTKVKTIKTAILKLRYSHEKFILHFSFKVMFKSCFINGKYKYITTFIWYIGVGLYTNTTYCGTENCGLWLGVIECMIILLVLSMFLLKMLEYDEKYYFLISLYPNNNKLKPFSVINLKAHIRLAITPKCNLNLGHKTHQVAAIFQSVAHSINAKHYQRYYCPNFTYFCVIIGISCVCHLQTVSVLMRRFTRSYNYHKRHAIPHHPPSRLLPSGTNRHKYII